MSSYIENDELMSLINVTGARAPSILLGNTVLINSYSLEHDIISGVKYIWLHISAGEDHTNNLELV